MNSRTINEQIDNARKTYIDVRVCMQKVIDGLPDSPHKSFKYAHYQNLVYKKVFGLNAGALRTKKTYQKLIVYMNNSQLVNFMSVLL